MTLSSSFSFSSKHISVGSRDMRAYCVWICGWLWLGQYLATDRRGAGGRPECRRKRCINTHTHNRRRSFFPPPSPSKPPPPPLNHPPSQADATSVSISINPTRSQGPRVPGWVRSTCYIHLSQEMYQSNRASLLWWQDI